MYHELGIALILITLGLSLGLPLFSWIVTGGIERDLLRVLYRLWCVCGVLLLLGIYLMMS